MLDYWDGVWETLQWATGAKLHSGGWSSLSKSVVNVLADSAFGAADPAFKSGLDFGALWASGYDTEFKDVFDSYGGTNGMISGGLLSGILSALAEGFGYVKTKKNQTNFKHLIQSSDRNLKNLVQGIIDEIPEDLDDVSKARMAYLLLCQDTQYSDEYLALQQMRDSAYDIWNSPGKNATEADIVQGQSDYYSASSKMSDIYHRSYDITDLDSNSVICNSWSEIYKDLLVKCGFDENKIHIIGDAKNLGHRFVEVELGGGNVLIADGTYVYGDLTDLTASKYGLDTNGFILSTDKEVKKAYEENGMEGLVELSKSKKSKSKVESTDKKIGYSDNILKGDFENMRETYSSGKETLSTEQKVKGFVEMLDDGYSTGVKKSAIDTYKMMETYAKDFFGPNTEASWVQVDDGIVAYVEIELSDSSMYGEPGDHIYIIKKNDNEFRWAKKRK